MEPLHLLVIEVKSTSIVYARLLGMYVATYKVVRPKLSSAPVQIV